MSVADDCLTLEVEATCREDGNVEESNNERMGVNFTSCEETGTKQEKDEQCENELGRNNAQFNGDSNGEKSQNREQESASSDPEVIEAVTEKRDGFVPIDVINNALRTRKSILRRTSSVSTDDSLGDENEFEGTPESPSTKNVRFNLNPNVRVFSNKKGKGKRKLEAKLRAEARKYSLESEGSGSEQSCGTSPADLGTGFNGFRARSLDSLDLKKDEASTKKERNNEVDEVNGAGNQNEKSAGSAANDDNSFGLTNSLIFELDA